MELTENELLEIKYAFQEFYNSKDTSKSDAEELAFSKVCNLETKTQHNISMIFFRGFVAGRKGAVVGRY